MIQAFHSLSFLLTAQPLPEKHPTSHRSHHKLTMTDFWLRKMKTYFQRIDFDKDGSITKKDFQGMADRVIERGQLNKEQQEKLREHLTDVSVRWGYEE